MRRPTWLLLLALALLFGSSKLAAGQHIAPELLMCMNPSGVAIPVNAGASGSGQWSGYLSQIQAMGTYNGAYKPLQCDVNGNLIVSGGGGSGLTSITWALPSWLTASPATLIANGTQTFSPTTGQASHQVIGTCGVGTTFAPCSLVLADLPTIPLSGLATQTANTVVGNGTASTAVPTALTMPSCSSATNALTWISGTGFGCNSIAGGGGVSSFSGDGALLSNSASTGAVTATLATAAAHKWWGNNTGITAAPGYQSPACADISNASTGCSTTVGTAATHPATDFLASTTVLPVTIAAVAHKWLNSYTSGTGAFTQTQPACADLSDSASGCSTAAYSLPTASTTVLGGVKVDGSSITIASGVISAATGTGTVTHTSGALTLGNIIIGNGTSDIKIDTGCSTDGAGNQTCASFTAGSGSNGKVTITDGATAVGNALTSAAGVLSWGTNTVVTSATQYKKLSCQPAFGDGVNAITAATYPQTDCYNDTGATITITGIKCFTDNNGSSTLNVTNGAGTGLLTGAVTCTTAFAAGTQSGTVTIANGDFLKFSFVADGTSKQTTWVVSETR